MDAVFDLDLPTKLDEALSFMTADGAMALAGGTNVIVDLRAKRLRPARLISLGRISDLRGIQSNNGMIVIGGCTTVTDLLRSDVIARTAPSLVQSARVFAGQMVRNTATVAGNIACGSPAADLMPPLLSLDAELTLVSSSGQRTIPLDRFFVDYKKTVSQSHELIREIIWKPLPERACNLFYKVARRKGDAISVITIAVTIAVQDGRCSWARIAIGAAAPTVFRAHDVEAMLEGETLTPALIDRASLKAAEACQPINDIRASADYRRHTVQVLTRRLVRQAWEQLN
jgi:CO/xanthine dehydrogenase FAD-binding subunit